MPSPQSRDEALYTNLILLVYEDPRITVALKDLLIPLIACHLSILKVLDSQGIRESVEDEGVQYLTPILQSALLCQQPQH